MSLTPTQNIRDQVDLIKRTVCKGATDTELELFMRVCERTGLDPFTRQIFAIKRYDSALKQEVMQTQVSIDGFRKLADDTGLMAGQLGPYWTGPNGEWQDVWLQDKPPRAARVIVLRFNPNMPDKPSTFTGVALWDSYCQRTREGNPTRMWAQMGPEMLAKCAESLALRKAFPQRLSGLYTSDEMSQAMPQRDDPDDHYPDGTPVRVKSSERPLIRPVSASTASPVLPPPTVPERASGGDTGASGETPDGADPSPMRRMVSVAMAALTADQRSTVLALGDKERLQLPDEKAYGVKDANRWMVLIGQVKDQGNDHS